jgi:uncharacterized protein (DUF885 family)
VSWGGAIRLAAQVRATVFPVDAASQQARLAYWTKTLATLDTIPFDQLSPEEKVNAQVFRASIRALANKRMLDDGLIVEPLRVESQGWRSGDARLGAQLSVVGGALEDL